MHSNNPSKRAASILKWLWASPCSLVGLLFAALVIALGGKANRSGSTLEVAINGDETPHAGLTRWLPFRAIALGHVIVATSPNELERLRAHELVHVAQYERWGLFFFPAYAASSMWQVLRGRDAYWNNHFEVEARALSDETQQAPTNTNT